MTLKAAIYRRVSTPGQQDNTSLADQLDLCRDYAEAQGYEVVADYCDVYTGADIKHRPRINDALRDAAAGHFEVFIVNHTDRLTREPRHQGYILTNLEIAGVRFESVGNPLDDSIAGMSQEFAHSLTSRVERDRIKERTMAGRAKRIRDGKLQPGSNPLFGYAFDDAAPGKKECYVEDATTSWVIRRVFREVVEGRSLRQIAEGLNANAIPTPKAKSGTQGWTAKQIKDIVKHPFYRGFAVANRWTSFKGSNGKRRTLERPESEWSALPDTVVPRLVDDATWHAANERLQRNKVEKTRPYDDPSDWLLRAGFVYCATCGCRMGAKRHSGTGQPMYRCNHSVFKKAKHAGGSVAAGTLDAFVWNRVMSWLADPGVLRYEMERSRPKLDADFGAELAGIDVRLAAISAEQDNLARSLGHLSAEAARPLIDRLNQLGEERTALQAERDSLAHQIANVAQAEQVVATVWGQIERYAAGISEWDYAQKREMLHRMGVVVRVRKLGWNRARVWVDVVPPWPDGTEWLSNLFGPEASGPFALERFQPDADPLGPSEGLPIYVPNEADDEDKDGSDGGSGDESAISGVTSVVALVLAAIGSNTATQVSG